VRKRNNDYSCDKITCPFFKAHAPTTISCEGVIPDTSTQQIFRTKASRILHENIFCAARFDYCEVYRATIKKYEED
jgi:hypothetical protein